MLTKEQALSILNFIEVFTLVKQNRNPEKGY
jgi:hypothetical protein